MTKPTKLQIMRRNRLKQEAAVAALEAEQAWARDRERFLDERTESYEDTRDWMADTKARVHAVQKPEPEPSTARVVAHTTRKVFGGLPLRLWRAIASVRRMA